MTRTYGLMRQVRRRIYLPPHLRPWNSGLLNDLRNLRSKLQRYALHGHATFKPDEQEYPLTVLVEFFQEMQSWIARIGEIASLSAQYQAVNCG